MTEELPPMLFKLRALNSPRDWRNLEAIFKRRSLWFSSPDKFNDPFEGHVSIKAQLPNADAMAFVNRMAKENHTGNRAERRELARSKSKTLAEGFRIDDHLPGLDSIGVLCLMDLAGIEDPSNEILAWSHYAGSHRGVALGFRVKEQPTENLFGLAYRVNYGLKRELGLSDDRAFEKSILTKAPCWSYEREWRVVSSFRRSAAQIQASLSAGAFELGGNMHSFLIKEPVVNAEAHFEPEDLLEVHLGARHTGGEKERVVSMARSCGLAPRFIDVRLHQTEFALIRSPHHR